MTTVEKLFVQIFERKNWIIEQVKQQTELYNQHLASKLLIDGITPPSWLWNPKFYSDAEDPNELKKEELISELLLPRVQSAVPCSGGCRSLHKNAVVTGNNGVLSEGLFMETHASSKGFEAGEGLTAVPECQDVDAGHALNRVPELDFSTTSPQEQMDGGISNIYAAPEQSFARIQRSKSRQKALELRNSAKAVANSHHHNVNNAGVSSSGFTASRIASQQPHQGNEFLELAKLSDINSNSYEVREAKEDCPGKAKGTNVYSGRITRSKSISLEYTSTIASKQLDHVDEYSRLAKSCHSSKDCCMGDAKVDCLSKDKGTSNYSGRITRSKSTYLGCRTSGIASKQPDNVDEYLELDKPCDISNGGCVTKETKIDCLSYEKGTNICQCRITRSRNYCKQPNSVNGALMQNRFSSFEAFSDIDKEDGHRKTGLHTTCSFKGVSRLVNSSNIVGQRISLSKSSASKKGAHSISLNRFEGHDLQTVSGSQLISHWPDTKEDASHKANAETAVGAKLVFAGPNEAQADCSKSNLEVANLRAELEVAASSPPLDHNMFVMPRQLGYDGMEESSLNEILYATLGKRKLDTSLEEANLVEPTESVPKLTSDNSSRKSLEKQSLMDKELSNKVGEAQIFFSEALVEECNTEKSNVNENSMLINVDNNLEAALQIRHSSVSREPIASLNKLTSDIPDRIYLERESLADREVSNNAEETCGVSFEGHVEECSSLKKLTPDNPDRKFSEKDSLVDTEVSNKTEEAHGVSFEAHVVDCTDNLEACLQVQHSYVSQEADIALQNVNKIPDVEICQNVKFHPTEDFESLADLKDREAGCVWRTETKPFSLENELLGQFIDSGVTKPVMGDSQSCLVEEMEMENPTSTIIANQNFLYYENKLGQECTGNVANTEGILQDGGCHPADDSSNECSSVGSLHGEDKNVSCDELEEINLEDRSLQLERRLRSGMRDSWPQSKRRKIVGQQTDFFSASPRFRMQKLSRIEGDSMPGYFKSAEGDAVAVQTFQNFPVLHEGEISRSIFYCHPVVDMHQKGKCLMEEQTEPSTKLGIEKEELGSEERAKFTNTPSTYKHQQFGQSIASGFTKHVAGDSQDCPIEKVIIEDQTNFVLDVRGACDEQDYSCLLRFENKVHPGNMDDFTSTDAAPSERPHLGKDGLFSYGLGVSPPNKNLDFVGADPTRPVFEGFIVDVQRENGQPHIPGYDISFDKLDLPNTTIERASVLEQLCKSSVMHTPFAQFSSIMKLHKTPDLYQSVPNGLLEHVDLGSNLPMNDDGGRQLRASSYSCVNEFKYAFERVSYSDCLSHPNAFFGQNSGKICTSPVGKFWERITSGSSSSEKNRSLNPELTCFPIEEDHSISEGDENNNDMVDTIQDAISSIAVNGCSRREPLVEIAGPYSNAPAPVSVAKKLPNSGSLDSVGTDSVTHSRVKRKLGNHSRNKKGCMNEAKENHSLSASINGTNKVTESLHNRFSKPKLSGKTSLRKGVQLLSERETKNNNIVSNITSFVPLVQQKQAAAVAVAPGKRDIKVKALEAAEAAKRHEEKKENERKMKKEAMKLERARLEEENLRQMDLKRKKKEEEQKKKYADMAARKRRREEEERKDKEKKRKRVEEMRRQQKEQEEKLHAGKAEKELQSCIVDEKISSGKESNNESRKHCKMEKKSGDDNTTKKPETQLQTAGVSSCYLRQASTVTEGHEISSDCFETGKAMIASDKSPLDANLVTGINQEKSYEISPYQCSDGEEEEEDVDDIPSRKFIPSWASKNCVALFLSSQQKIDPDVIFPESSFCHMDEVLLPRKIQPK